LVVAIVALLLFGAGRVAELGKGMGEGIRAFKRGIRDDDEEPTAGTERELPLSTNGEGPSASANASAREGRLDHRP
jgi:sec-independent protein translocase protein TatA